MSTSSIRYTRPWLADYQLDAIFNNARVAVCEGSVQSGKTLACEVWLFEHAWNSSNKTFWWVSRNATVAGLAFEELLEILPDEVKEEAITRTISAEGKQRIDFLNGSTIKFKSADAPDSLYGDTVSGCVVDEASRVSEEAWNAVTTRLSATGGPIRVIGNVKGRNNWFWRLARYVEDGNGWECSQCGNSFRSNYHYAKITVIDSLKAGISDLEYVKQEYATMDKQSFMQAYLSEAPDDGGNPFGISDIDNVAVDPKKLPDSEDSKVVAWGWDIAKDQNYTVGIGLDYDGNVVEYHRWQKESFASQIARMTSLVGTTSALVDATRGSHGDQLLERLKDRGGNNWRGQLFSGKNKQNLMQGLAVAIQNRDITIPKGQIVKELKNFEYEERRQYTIYSAPDGLMDDCVDALALAVKQWRDVTKMPSDAAPIGLGGESAWSI